MQTVFINPKRTANTGAESCFGSRMSFLLIVVKTLTELNIDFDKTITLRGAWKS